MLKKLLTIASLTLMSSVGFTQTYELKRVEFNVIDGAPRFKQPRFITDENGDMLSVEKNGYAHPLVYDWNGDGKKDILIGEYGAKYESNIKVFENIGSAKKPVYSSEFYYAEDIKGDKLAIYGY